MSLEITIASYNILANSYVKPEWFPNSEAGLLAWTPRRERLAGRLLELDADLLCLQEVEQAAFDFLAERLAGHGYRGVFGKKTDPKPDGCATFFKEARLPLLSAEAVHYQDREKGQIHSGNLALICGFGLDVGLLRVANTHIKWDDRPQPQHTGFRQASALRQLLAEPARAAVGWVVCGDFNAEPDGFVLQQMLAAGLEDGHRSQPQPTCNANGRAKRIDYILHSASIASVPLGIPELDDRTPLPSEAEPSDHLALLAALRLGSAQPQSFPAVASRSPG